MGTTTNRSYPYPASGDAPDVVSDMTDLASAIDADVQTLVPVGTIIAFAGVATPSGWLMCDGSSFSEVTYPGLYAALGNTNTTPNLADRFLKGSATPRTTGGSKTITTSNLPSHDHLIGYTANVAAGGDYTGLVTNSVSSPFGTGATGSGADYEPLHYTVRYLIRAT